VKALKTHKYMKYKFVLLPFVLIALAGTAHAATGGLPWEAPITTLSNSVPGPLACAVSLIGIVGTGGILICAGGHVNEFLLAIVFCVLVIAFIIAAKDTLTAFGFVAGATV
jgi:type IV secretion system protein TrbC